MGSWLQINMVWNIKYVELPVQLNPSPVKPSLQIHLYDPSVILHDVL